jgi:hypothetical protein
METAQHSNALPTVTAITTKTKYSQPGGKQLSLHDDKFRYDEREMHATKKLT